MSIALENKINNFQSENEAVRIEIIQRTDEHLDILIRIKSLIEPLTQKWRIFFSEVIEPINNLSNEELNSFLPKFYELYASSIKLVAILKKGRIKTDLKVTVRDFCTEVELLHELIYDIENHRLNEDGELRNIIDSINAM